MRRRAAVAFSYVASVLTCLAVVAAAVLAAEPAPAAAGSTEPTAVLILFDGAVTDADMAALHRAGGRVDHRYGIVPAVAALLPQAALDGLRHNPRVRAVEPDARVVALDYRATHDWGIGHVRADEVHASGNTGTTSAGSAARVAVLDSGIDCGHDELPVERCQLGPTYVEGTTSSDDDWGHGTHVAGSVAAERHVGLSTGVVGVAPSAHVTAYKVLDDQGYGSISDVIAAVDAVWNGGAPAADIINMSLGWSSGSSTFQQAMDRAYASGIALFAAAGNGGNCGGSGKSVSYPARYESVVAVGAVDSLNQRPCWSSTGAAVELAAPGVSVFSTWPADLTASARDPQPVCENLICHYKYGSGTSMAVPHAVGAAALVIASGSVSDTNATNGVADEVRRRLQETAVDLGANGRDTHYGFGLVDALAATGGSGGGGETPPAGSIVLEARGYKVKGLQKADLSWSGATTTNVDVHRDGTNVATTANDGAETDHIDAKGSGSYVYKVCEVGTTNCSNEVSVSF